MMTGRAEYRIYLRQDNADLRLTEKGRALGLVSDERYAAFTKRQEEIEEIRRTMNVVLKADGRLADMLSAICESATSSVKLCDLIKRPRVDRRLVSAHYDVFDGFDVHNVDYVVNELKYEGYLKKERAEIERMKKLDDVLIPDVDFETIKGLRLEARQKLNKIKPKTLGQASRISGVSPADVTVLLLMLKKEC
jgi:tRNA uridine 5-carboxymethylaminomethyl modification enzyme